MKKIYFALFISLLWTCVYGQKTKIEPGDDATNYKLRIVTSARTIKELPVRELKGNIIILFWWDRGCHYSKDFLREFNAFYNQYNKKVLFYAISNDPWSYIIKYAKRNNYKFPFCSDAAALENKYFPFSAASHSVIINSKGICLYHGYLNLSNAMLDTLISKDQLPIETQNFSDKTYAYQQFRNDFNEYSKSFDSYHQTDFKLEPYKSNKGTFGWTKVGGEYKSYYGYNLSVYQIYREGLVLKDSRIIIADSLKKRLSSTDTSNLYNVGFNIRKRNKYSGYHYRNVFRTYLDSAFGLSTRLVKRKQNVILITKIYEGSNITRTEYVSEKKIQNDTLLLKNCRAEDLVSDLNDYLPITFGNKILKQRRYNFKIILDKNATDKDSIVDQLRKQGIDSKVKKARLTYLEFLPQKEVRSVTYFHTQPKKLIFRWGYKIGLGPSYFNFTDDIYHGNKIVAYNAGVFTRIKLNNYLAFQPEINYLSSGSKGNYAKFRTHSIYTPANILLTTSQRIGVGLYVKAGGYYANNFAGKIEGQNLTFDTIERNKFGWSWGVGLWLEDFNLELSYNRGLSNIIKNSTIGNVKEKISLITRMYYF